MARESTPQTIHRKDYRKPEYTIDSVDLLFQINGSITSVSANLKIKRIASKPTPLVLHGEGLRLKAIQLDGKTLSEDQYRAGNETLVIDTVPEQFELATTVELHPAENTALEGLYQSGRFLLTQCEAQGFRKITWFLDRPDVMARYRVRIEAEKSTFPVLLSNGNLSDSGELDGGRHFVTWDDPFRKPSYLFALVAGDLECLSDTFQSADGRSVDLRVYAEAENVDKLDYAMASLKRSMRWDEERFGLIYDLDVYNIVATNDFNMGAMENKGLNIFNAKYVLARPDTATDADYMGIEGVIGHEYFHNWTGNRVTCRDWFQLTLKEGLTVFRDQEFTSDMHSRAIKRIEDVRMLRGHQFAEDAGPMAHPIRPEKYIEINNFYTLTVYEKGAEVIRMIHTLLGEEGFRRGMDLYFERHDGHAVTCDDFVAAMADANNADLEQFSRWYATRGTPTVSARGAYQSGTQRYTLELEQSLPFDDTVDSTALHIPFRVCLLDDHGKAIGHCEALRGDVYDLRTPKAQLTFENVTSVPTPSLLRGFSAPVHLEFGYRREDLRFLAVHDDDPFNRWEAMQRLATEVILQCAAEPDRSPDLLLLEACRDLALDQASDPALLAEMLSLPDLQTLVQKTDIMDVHGLHSARTRVHKAIAEFCAQAFADRILSPGHFAEYRPVADQIGARALSNICLSYLVTEGRGVDAACRQYESADNMTDRLAALRALVMESTAAGQRYLDDFAGRFANDALVMDKWFALQASVPGDQTLRTVETLMQHPAFSMKNPNKVRALLGAFSRNLPSFHATTGDGYTFLAEQTATLDKLNPQVAARLVAAFNSYKRLPPEAREKVEAELTRLKNTKDLSKDVFEIVSSALTK